MQTILKENGGIPTSLLLTFAIVAGASVANLYYNQPLLGSIGRDLHISELSANHIALFTQMGYALGLLFVVPLGDLFNRKHIMMASYTLLVIALLTVAWTTRIEIIYLASLLTGICSITPQLFIPIAAQYSEPSRKGRNVGLVVSGLLTGILASRVVSGLVGEVWGWRTMYYIAAILMCLCGLLMVRVLPELATNYRGTYAGLMRSVLSLIHRYPQLRFASVRSGLAFGSFLGLWSCLAFHMEQAPFYAGSDVVGLLGLCGVAGALTASLVGRYVHVLGVWRFNILGCLLFLAAWTLLWLYGDTYGGIIGGILLMDLGMQCIQLSNQTTIFALEPQASNRLNTVFMTSYFTGGSLGVLVSGTGWTLAGWNGVVAAGVALTLGSLLLNPLAERRTR